MSGSAIRFWLLAAVLVAVNVAGWVWVRYAIAPEAAAGQVRVVSISPQRDAENADRVTLVFDREIAGDEQLGEPLDIAPFDIDPKPEGHWLWAARDRLQYVLTRRLPLGMQYVVKPAEDFETQLGWSIVGESQFEVQTARLKVKACDLLSADEQHVTFELSFNQPVEPGELIEHLKVTDAAGGEPIDVTPLVRGAADRITLRTVRPTSSAFRVVIDPELRGYKAQLQLDRPWAHHIKLDQPLALVRADVPTPDDDERISVSLRFNAELQTRQTPPQVEVTPPVAGVRTRISRHALVIDGPFVCGVRYTAKVPATVLDDKGRTLAEAQSVSFTIPDRRPTLRVPMSRGTLMPTGNLALDMSVTNVSGVTLEAWRVHANNLVAELRGESERETSRHLSKKKVPLDLQRNELRTVAVELSDLIATHGRGVYRIAARADERYWLNDAVVVSVTDLALTSKQQRDGLAVWVTSLSTAAPVEGATVRAMSYNNQVIAETTTGPDGLADFTVPENHPDGGVWAIVAMKADDMAYLRPDRRTWAIEGVDQSGRPHPETYEVMLYGERGVYRPGDTVHVTGILRDGAGRVPEPMPIEVQVYRPDGRRVAELYAPPEQQQQGVFHVDFESHDDGQLGRYRFVATLPGDDKPIGEMGTLIEAFMPVRMVVTAEATQAKFKRDDEPAVKVDAQYLFGQPGAGLPVAVSGAATFRAFSSKRHEGFAFGDSSQWKRVTLKEQSAKLGDDGRATVKIDKTDFDDAPPALYTGEVTATVTEPGGRSVSARAAVTVDTAGRHIGLRLPNAKFRRVGESFNVDWVRVDSDDEPLAGGAIKFTLNRIEGDTIAEEVNGRVVMKWKQRPVMVMSSEAAGAEATGTLPLNCEHAGEYRLEAIDIESGAVTAVTFYAARDIGQFESLAMRQPERVELTLDRDQYAPGATAELILRSPFVGTALITIETDRVVTRRVLTMRKNTVKLALPVDESIRGGAFVTATVVRAIDPTRREWLPHRALGMVRLVTDHGDRRLAVAIDAPDRAEPGEAMTIHVRTGAAVDNATSTITTVPTGARWFDGVSGEGEGGTTTQPIAAPGGATGVAHLWAVDDGILLTTSYQTPDPMKHFLAPRKHAVVSADGYADLLPDHERALEMTRIGAGKEGEFDDAMAMRRNPVASKRREPAVVWRTVVPLDADGNAAVTMTMPKLNGRMRLMAVVVDGDHYGSMQRDLTLTSPLIVESSWPRFVAPGDQFRAPVKLFNTTESPMRVTLDLQPDGPIDIAAPPQGEWVVEPGKPVTVWLEVTARDAVGAVTVKTAARGEGLGGGAPVLAMIESDFVVRPGSPLHGESRLVQIKAGEKLKLELGEAFRPGAARVRLRVSGEPSVTLGPAVEKLLDYPYGCVEQTTSRLYAILYAPQLLEAMDGDDRRGQLARTMIEAGITRLWSMQTRHGGLSYWPGGTQSYRWGSAYAAAFLMRAQRAGFEIDPRFTEGLVDYLEAELNESGSSAPDDNMRALLCHVLTAFGRPQQGWTARLTENLAELDVAGRAHLAGAWIELGRKDRAAEVLDGDLLAIEVATTTQGRLTSPTQQDAELLQALLDLEPGDARVALLARRVEERRADGWWGTTLSSASALCALARYQQLDRPKPNFTGVVKGQGSIDFTHEEPVSARFDKVAGPIDIETTGEGAVFVAMTTEGLAREGAIEPYDHTIEVRRRWLDVEGKAIDPEKIEVGDLVFVEVDLVAPELHDNSLIHNIAIVDALPGGFEVENPRLDTSQSASPLSGWSDRVQFMDDRVVLFSFASKKTQTFRYALRAVTSGRFAVPPVQASCMYDPSAASVHGGGVVEIAP